MGRGAVGVEGGNIEVVGGRLRQVLDGVAGDTCGHGVAPGKAHVIGRFVNLGARGGGIIVRPGQIDLAGADRAGRQPARRRGGRRGRQGGGADRVRERGFTGGADGGHLEVVGGRLCQVFDGEGGEACGYRVAPGKAHAVGRFIDRRARSVDIVGRPRQVDLDGTDRVGRQAARRQRQSRRGSADSTGGIRLAVRVESHDIEGIGARRRQAGDRIAANTLGHGEGPLKGKTIRRFEDLGPRGGGIVVRPRKIDLIGVGRGGGQIRRSRGHGQSGRTDYGGIVRGAGRVKGAHLVIVSRGRIQFSAWEINRCSGQRVLPKETYAVGGDVNRNAV